MTNQIPIAVENYNDYVLTARERMMTYLTKDDPFSEWFWELTYKDEKYFWDVLWVKSL